MGNVLHVFDSTECPLQNSTNTLILQDINVVWLWIFYGQECNFCSRNLPIVKHTGKMSVFRKTKSPYMPWGDMNELDSKCN